jgi:hypothetical protein
MEGENSLAGFELENLSISRLQAYQ